MNRLRVAVTGSQGRLGAAICRELALRHDVIPLPHQRMDLGDGASIRAALEPLAFDALINAAALSDVDYCEAHPAEAMRINAVAVADLAAITRAKGARLVQISTDYVFAGDTDRPYSETDETRPVNEYGVSKRQGEIEALNVSPLNLVLRVSWLFGPDRPSFVDAILRRAAQEERVEAVADKISIPSYTVDLARNIEQLIDPHGSGGLFHLCNSGPCTWQEYGQFSLDCAHRLGMPLRCRTVHPIRLVDIRFKATRPVYTALSTEKLAAQTPVRPRSWQGAVEEYVRDFAVPRHSC